MMKSREMTPRKHVQRMYNPKTEQDKIQRIRQALRRERFGRDLRVKISCRVLIVIVVLALPMGVAKEIWPGWWWMIIGVAWFVATVALFYMLMREVRDER